MSSFISPLFPKHPDENKAGRRVPTRRFFVIVMIEYSFWNYPGRMASGLAEVISPHSRQSCILGFVGLMSCHFFGDMTEESAY